MLLPPLFYSVTETFNVPNCFFAITSSTSFNNGMEFASPFLPMAMALAVVAKSKLSAMVLPCNTPYKKYPLNVSPRQWYPQQALDNSQFDIAYPL